MDKVGKLGRVVIEATDHRELTGVSSTVEEDKALGFVIDTEELAQSENAESRDLLGRVGDFAKGLVSGICGVALRDTRPDVGFGKIESSLRFELGAVDGVPIMGELPEIPEDPKTSLIGQDRLGVVLNGPEGFRMVPDTHNDPAVILILRPCQLLDLSSSLGPDVERVVANDFEVRQTSEDLRASVFDNGNLTMLYSTEAVDGSLMLNTQTLLTQADTKGGNHVLIGHFPDITDNTDIGGNIW
jgi:hypothetical protein